MSYRAYNFLPASLLAILVVSVLLAVSYIKSSTEALIQFGEEYNTVLGRVVSNAMKKELFWVLRDHGLADYVNKPAILDEAEHAIAEIINDTPIVWVRMYDDNGSTVISTGSLKALATEQQSVPRTVIPGHISSELRAYRDTDRDGRTGRGGRVLRVIESYIPFAWDDSGTTVKGTFEIYSDVSGFERNLFINPMLVIILTFSIMAMLYATIIALYRKNLKEMKWRGSVKKREDLLERVSSRFIEAQEDERKKIGRDIHDDAGQWLSVLKFRLEALADKDGPTGLKLESELDGLLELVQKTIDSIRNVVIQLRPSVLDDLGLCPALNWLVRTSNDALPGLTVDLDVSIGEDDVPVPLKTTIFRVIQEALSNMGRHSMADHGKVTVYKRRGRIFLEIRDNGQGFNPASVCQDGSGNCGFGMVSMRERTEVSGGELRILTAPGEGAVISATWDTSK